MAGLALLGFLAGSGFWLTALTLYTLHSAYIAAIEALARPPTPARLARRRRTDLIFRIAVLAPLAIALIIMAWTPH